MRRLDWFLATVVAMFLLGAIVIEANALRSVGLAWGHARAIGDDSAVAVRRLVSHLPNTPILPGDAR